MLEKLEDVIKKYKNKIGYGLTVVSLSTIISCTAYDIADVGSRGAVSGMVSGIVSGFSQHAGRRIGEALLGAQQIRVLGVDGKEHLKTMSPNGYNPINDPEIKDIRLSPDRQQAVFSVDFGGQYEIFKVDKDGSNLERLTFTPNESEVLPTFSPDGEKLAFMRYYKKSGICICVDILTMGLKNREEKKIQTLSYGDELSVFYTQNYGSEFWHKYIDDPCKFFKIEWRKLEIYNLNYNVDKKDELFPCLYFNYHEGYGWEEIKVK